MQDDFREPIPSMQVEGTLLFGAKPVRCFIVSVMSGGFRVAVPGLDRYQGNSRLTLATGDQLYPVEVVQEEANVDGYSYWLETIEEDRDSRSRPWIRRCLTGAATHLCTSGFIVAMLLGCFWIPGFRDRFPVHGQTIYDDISGNALSIGAASNVASAKPLPHAAQMTQSASPALHAVSDSNDPTPSRQTISEASLSNHAAARDDVPPSSVPQSPVTPHVPSLKILLAEGEAGHGQMLTKSLVPWLVGGKFEKTKPIRVSEAAQHDLKRFETGLKSLSPQDSSNAILELRNVMRIANTDSHSGHETSGFPNLYYVASNDATVYFKRTHGRMDIVRILPSDLIENQ